jgi:hypothetical protein
MFNNHTINVTIHAITSLFQYEMSLKGWRISNMK